MAGPTAAATSALESALTLASVLALRLPLPLVLVLGLPAESATAALFRAVAMPFNRVLFNPFCVL